VVITSEGHLRGSDHCRGSSSPPTGHSSTEHWNEELLFLFPDFPDLPLGSPTLADGGQTERP
jgi:hypothetical protein